MARRRRGVRVLKWVGTGMCVVIAAAFIANIWWAFKYVHRERLHWSVGIFGSELSFEAYQMGEVEWKTRRPEMELLDQFKSRWWIGPQPYPLRHHWFWPPLSYRHVASAVNWSTTFRVTLWFILATALIPTLGLWILDLCRRHPYGHCRTCGYNLTGLTSARCPECGAPTPATPPAGRS